MSANSVLLRLDMLLVLLVLVLLVLALLVLALLALALPAGRAGKSMAYFVVGVKSSHVVSREASGRAKRGWFGSRETLSVAGCLGAEFSKCVMRSLVLGGVEGTA